MMLLCVVLSYLIVRLIEQRLQRQEQVRYANSRGPHLLQNIKAYVALSIGISHALHPDLT